jgi:hypothetical protein
MTIESMVVESALFRQITSMFVHCGSTMADFLCDAVTATDLIVHGMRFF